MGFATCNTNLLLLIGSGLVLRERFYQLGVRRRIGIAIKPDNGFTRASSFEFIPGNMLDVSRIIFHLRSFELKLILLILRCGYLALEFGLVRLEPLRFLDDRVEKEHQTRKNDNDRDGLYDAGKRRPDIAATLSFKRNAGRIKKSGASHNCFCLLEGTSVNGVVTKFFFNAEQLIIFGKAIRAGE